MVRRSLRFLLVIGLLALNGFLFLSLKEKNGDLHQTFLELSQSPAGSYFEERCLNSSRILWHRYHYSIKDNQNVLASISDSLTQAVHAIHKQYVADRINYEAVGSTVYFSDRMAIDASLQSRLFREFEKYNSEVSRVLEQVIPRKRAHLDSVVEAMQEKLRIVENECKQTPPGTKLQRNIDAFTLRGIRTVNSIEWETNEHWSLGYDDYLNLMARFKQSARSSRVLQLENSLGKMNVIFASPGELNFYGKTYSLSAITIGELDSACKYMLLLQWQTNTDFLASFEEVTNTWP